MAEEKMICVCWSKSLRIIDIYEIGSFADATSACVVIKGTELYVPVIKDGMFHGEFRHKRGTKSIAYVCWIKQIVKKYGYGPYFNVKQSKHNWPLIRG